MTDETVVCFDIGGVLVQIGHSWDEACVASGVGTIPLGGPHGLNNFEPLIQYQAGSMKEAEFLTRLGEWLDVDSSGAKRIHQAILRDDYPGAHDLVQELKGLGVFTCCFSNTNALHWPILTDPVLHPAVADLDRRFASHEIADAKPSLASFQVVEAAMPRHERVVFFDDTLENIVGAAEAGWEAFRIDPHADPVSQMRRTLRGLGILPSDPVEGKR